MTQTDLALDGFFGRGFICEPAEFATSVGDLTVLDNSASATSENMSGLFSQLKPTGGPVGSNVLGGVPTPSGLSKANTGVQSKAIRTRTIV